MSASGQEHVYFCDTMEEVNAHAMERRCVAFHARETTATAEASATEAEGALDGKTTCEIEVMREQTSMLAF